jgi:hypothetical protein
MDRRPVLRILTVVLGLACCGGPAAGAQVERLAALSKQVQAGLAADRRQLPRAKDARGVRQATQRSSKSVAAFVAAVNDLSPDDVNAANPKDPAKARRQFVELQQRNDKLEQLLGRFQRTLDALNDGDPEEAIEEAQDTLEEILDAKDEAVEAVLEMLQAIFCAQQQVFGGDCDS